MGRRSAEFGLLWAAIAAGAFVLALLLVAAWQFSQMQSSLDAQVRLSSASAAQIDRLLEIVNEETGVRGYTATGDPTYLDIYYRSREALRRDEAAIARIHTPGQKRTLQAAARVQLYFERQIARVRAHRLAEARGMLAVGKVLLDRFRALDAAAQQDVRRQVVERRTQTRILAQAGFSASIVLCILVVLWIAVFGVVLRTSKTYRLSSLRDSLTGAQNRQGALAAIDAQISAPRPQPFGLIFIDLDGFKKINDSYGHAAGDAILQGVTARLQSTLRAIDIVCRLGGDEFACIVSPPASARELHTIATRLRKVLAAPYEFGGDTYVVGCSIGLSMYPEHGETADALLARADRAMYSAKAAGGGVREATAERC